MARILTNTTEIPLKLLQYDQEKNQQNLKKELLPLKLAKTPKFLIKLLNAAVKGRIAKISRKTVGIWPKRATNPQNTTQIIWNQTKFIQILKIPSTSAEIWPEFRSKLLEWNQVA